MGHLTEREVGRFRHDGFLSPLDGIGPDLAAQGLEQVAAIERHIGGPISAKESGQWRSSPHIYLPFFARLVRHPALLDVAEDLFGPDILVFISTFFVKEAGSPTFAAWHQDATYFGLQPNEHATFWVALSDAPLEAGCMEVVSSQGAPRQLPHNAARHAHSINGAGQEAVVAIDESKRVAMPLSAGQFSVHHTHCLHRSLPNRTAYRRVGYGISYIPTRVAVRGAERLNAMLVRGSDRFGHFDLLPEPEAAFDPAALARHERAYKTYRRNYVEQEARHAAQFGTAAV